MDKTHIGGVVIVSERGGGRREATLLGKMRHAHTWHHVRYMCNPWTGFHLLFFPSSFLEFSSSSFYTHQHQRLTDPFRQETIDVHHTPLASPSPHPPTATFEFNRVGETQMAPREWSDQQVANYSGVGYGKGRRLSTVPTLKPDREGINGVSGSAYVTIPVPGEPMDAQRRRSWIRRYWIFVLAMAILVVGGIIAGAVGGISASHQATERGTG
ncbi:hypothetical protein CTA2_5257 [Colletotrichum tanaceti]|uniref:Uncharacterized protein n=1 Tax=Colletotrichum tanaceti TaxID=1306861 RepID=A0A4U6XCS5_9PEZI|nr:hypothetical protein CTA2_5257 [Colletotrichum tanaceti]TKW51617.1 hypothetical protein CTA1_3607 [Colletotrichum tanaceti]